MPFQHYTLTHRAIATVSRWFDGTTYTVRHGLLTGMKRKGGLGWVPMAPHETAEDRFFQQLDLSGATVYDIGGFQGLLTLFFSARAQHVVVYEPNQTSLVRLRENLALNGVENVTVRPIGLGAAATHLTLTYDPLMPGGASGNTLVGGQIAETTEGARTTPITVQRLDDDIRAERLPLPTFIKIDVEGMELDVLTGMPESLRTFPRLFIELHGAERPDKLANALAVVALLRTAGYTRITCVEDGRDMTPEAIEREIPSHLDCQR